MSDQRRPSGFTLVELLVSLVIMAATAGLLLSGLGTGRHVWEIASDRAVASESIGAAQGILRDRLEHLYPATRLDASSAYVDMRGDARQFSFFAPALAAQQPSGLRRFRIALDGRDTLMLYSVDASVSRVNIDAPTTAGWSAAPLIDGIAAFDIDYFGIAPPDNTRRWRSFWQDRPAPPELIRIRLRFADSGRRTWPDLIVRPAASVGSDCQIDAPSGRCRGAG